MTQSTATSRGRGRPRAVPSSGVEPAREILETAARLFSSKGIAATRITDIASEIGIAAPTIYYHFDNLDTIVETLLRYVVEESAAFASHEAGRPGRCADRLRSLIEQHVDRLTSGPYDVWFVMQFTESDAHRFPTIARRSRQWRQAVLRLIEEGIAAGEFRDVDARLAAAMVTGMIYGALQMRREHGAIDSKEAADFIVHSLAPRGHK